MQVPGRDDCEDVDECRSSPCTNGRCRNLPGSYMCDCFPGFAESDDHKMCLGLFRSCRHVTIDMYIMIGFLGNRHS